MSTKSAATISAMLTVVLLILLAILLLLLQMVALNGAGERQGMTAMGLALACQSIVVILLATLAARATNYLISRANWNPALAVAVAVIVATTIGGTLSFLSSIVAIPLAGLW